MASTRTITGLIQQQEIGRRYHLRLHEIAPSSPAGSLPDETALFFSLLRQLAIERPDLLEHGDRTASYALLLGNAVGLAAADLMHLHYAALLHDIGQLLLPPGLLEGNRPLTADEYALIQSHPRAGAMLLEPISFLRVPGLWIAHHHERWDGAGYPYGLRGAFIPFGSRILAVADTFDALISSLTHRPGVDPASAYAQLRIVAGSQLDPELVEVFLRQDSESLTSGCPDGLR